MNFSALIDWPFFWSVFNNLLYSVLPLALIYIAIKAVGMLLEVIIGAIRRAKS